MWGIISNFVAFSEKFSFKNPPLCNNVQGKWLLTIWHANQRLESREAGAYFSVFALAISKCCHFPVFWSAVFISHPFWAKWESLVGFTYKCRPYKIKVYRNILNIYRFFNIWTICCQDTFHKITRNLMIVQRLFDEAVGQLCKDCLKTVKQLPDDCLMTASYQ